MTAKLTLSINPTVVSHAKRYAKQQGVSLSRLVEVYLASLLEQPAAAALPPLTASLRGLLNKAGTGTYRKHLARKYLRDPRFPFCADLTSLPPAPYHESSMK
jgi:hypothetical protein